MKKLSLLLLFLSLTFAATAFAAPADEAATQASKRQAVLRLLEATDAKQITNQMIAPVQAIVDQQFNEQDFPPESKETVQKLKGELKAWVAQQMSWDNVKDIYIDVYAEVFTEQELNEITAFYQTPLGKKMLQKMPALVQTTLQRTQGMMQQKLPEIEKHMEESISELQTKYKKKD
jgi:hypothetical protein